jgi:hypothetical protein
MHEPYPARYLEKLRREPLLERTSGSDQTQKRVPSWFYPKAPCCQKKEPKKGEGAIEKNVDLTLHEIVRPVF